MRPYEATGQWWQRFITLGLLKSREVICMGRPFKCPYCGASDNVSKGVRRTKTMGDRRIFRCRACKRKYTPKHQRGAEPEEEKTYQGRAAPHEAATSA